MRTKQQNTDGSHNQHVTKEITASIQHASNQLSTKTLFFSLALLWLTGVGLRLTILAPAPIISFIHADLNMSETQIGLLSSIPALLFASTSVFGALLIARFGALATVILGLLITALGSALSGAALSVLPLYLATLFTGFGVAVMQPSMPSLVREWLASHVRMATAVYTNGLLIGGILPVALSVPFVMPLLGGWRIDLVFWGIACVMIALILLMFAPREKSGSVTVESSSSSSREWRPDWRRKLIWQLGFMFGSVNAIYFSVTFFIPRYLQVTGHENTISAALVALNVGQLPASILLLFLGGLEQRTWPYVSAGLISLLAMLGILFGNSLTIIGSAFILGFATGTVLILMLALPPILSAPAEVHRTSAAMLTIGYFCAVITPIVSGLVWDMTGVSVMAFVPIGLSALMLMILAVYPKRFRVFFRDLIQRIHAGASY